jgi:hypothetical protein
VFVKIYVTVPEMVPPEGIFDVIVEGILIRLPVFEPLEVDTHIFKLFNTPATLE